MRAALIVGLLGRLVVEEEERTRHSFDLLVAQHALVIADAVRQQADLLALVRRRVEVLREARDLRPHAVLDAQTSRAQSVVQEALEERQVQIKFLRELVHAVTRTQLQVIALQVHIRTVYAN